MDAFYQRLRVLSRYYDQLVFTFIIRGSYFHLGLSRQIRFPRRWGLKFELWGCNIDQRHPESLGETDCFKPKSFIRTASYDAILNVVAIHCFYDERKYHSSTSRISMSQNSVHILVTCIFAFCFFSYPSRTLKSCWLLHCFFFIAGDFFLSRKASVKRCLFCLCTLYGLWIK